MDGREPVNNKHNYFIELVKNVKGAGKAEYQPPLAPLTWDVHKW